MGPQTQRRPDTNRAAYANDNIAYPRTAVPRTAESRRAIGASSYLPVNPNMSASDTVDPRLRTSASLGSDMANRGSRDPPSSMQRRPDGRYANDSIGYSLMPTAEYGHGINASSYRIPEMNDYLDSHAGRSRMTGATALGTSDTQWITRGQSVDSVDGGRLPGYHGLTNMSLVSDMISKGYIESDAVADVLRIIRIC